ncbi:hypothetical protein BJX65DRAFT_251557 [Aspergillus insuetus]
MSFLSLCEITYRYFELQARFILFFSSYFFSWFIHTDNVLCDSECADMSDPIESPAPAFSSLLRPASTVAQPEANSPHRTASSLL